MMQKKIWLAGLLAVCMLLSSCSLIVKDPEVDAQTEILNVNGTSITKAQVNKEIDNYLAYLKQYYSYYGYNIDTSDASIVADARNSVIDGLIEDEVVKQKQAELLGDLSAVTLTEEEEADIKSRLESAHSTIQTSFYADTELEGEELENAIKADMERYLGVTEASLRESTLANHISDMFKSKVTEGVTVTDEEIQADYDSKVASEKSSYESNLSAYGSAVNGGSATIYYRPAGYRMVKQILIQFNDEDQAIVDDIESKISAENTAISTLTTSLTDAGVADVDALVSQVKVTMADAATAAEVAVAGTEAAFEGEVSEENQDNAKLLAEAKARLAAYEAMLATATETAYANIREQADTVVTAARGGLDWDGLVAEYNDDPGMTAGRETAETGYAVCKDMSGFDAAFTEAAMALEKIGDISDPIQGSSDGYYIIRYVADVAEGAVDLADVKDEISSDLLSSKQDTFYEEQVKQWVDAAKVVKNLKALDD